MRKLGLALCGMLLVVGQVLASGQTAPSDKRKIEDSRGHDWRVGAGGLTLSAGTCTGNALNGTQYVAYPGCSLSASGGTAPYTYSWSTSSSYGSLPPGLVLNSSTGAITGTNYGQGQFGVEFSVKDSASSTASVLVTFTLTGDNTTGGCTLFPSDSGFHIKVTSLPVDTSPAAPISSSYTSSALRVGFGNANYANQPNGIPFIRVPATQAMVSVDTTQYQSYFSSGPWPWYANVEGSQNSFSSGGDAHSSIIQMAAGGGNCALWEMWQSNFTGTLYTNGPWSDSSNAYWPNISSTGTGAYAMLPQGNGSTDAAGLPLAPLLLNADEVIGTGTPTAPNGVVQHPTRFTLNNTLARHVWPATAQAGVGSCSGGHSDSNELILQPGSPGGSAPTSCSGNSPDGEIYRLKASVANPSCASSSPQAAIIIQGFRDYGIIVADNGLTGMVIGTPDARWNDNDLSCLTKLTLANFEPVNVESVIKTLDSSNLPTVSYQTTSGVIPPTSTITSVAASCSPTSVSMGQTATCTATVKGTGTFVSTVTWTATDGTVTSAGVFTPSAAGSASITATSTQTTTMSGSSAVAVTAVTPPVTQAATPTFSPAAGTYASAQSVAIGDSTIGATIYYTTNGSTPTASSTEYSGPIAVSSTEILEAIATATGYTTSTVGTAAYTISTTPPPPPTGLSFSPVGGTYTSPQTVTITSSTPGATIYYTTSGTTPNTGSSVYSSPITVSGSTSETVQAIAVVGSGTATYAFGSSAPIHTVQSSNGFAASATSVPAVFTSSVTSGNLVLVAVSTYDAETIKVPTDTLGNSFTPLVSSGVSGSAVASIYAAVAKSSGADTVTCGISAANNIHCHIYEVAGVTGVVDATGASSATGTALTVSTSKATTNAADYVFAYFADNHSEATYTVGSGYGDTQVSEGASSGDSGFSEDKVVSTVGIQTATTKSSTTDVSVNLIVALH